MSVSDAEVIEVLTCGGATVADHFLIEEAVFAVNSHGQLMMLLIEDEDEALAATAYLRRIGAPQYASHKANEEQRQR